jgi:hypothetical protein
MSNEIITHQDNSGFMQVNTLDAAIKCSELIAASSFCPKGYMGQAGNVLVALQMGQELGLKPMQALQNIAVINGRPSLWGDAMIAVCRQSKDWEYVTETYNEATKTATCIAKRKNEPEVTRTFSMDDAKTAKLLGKEGPWSTYPKRMCQMRARGFALRDCFSDMLRGIISKEEAEDMPRERMDYSRVKGDIIEGVVEISSDDLQVLREKIKDASSQEVAICEHLKIGCLEEMTSSQFYEVCKLLDKKIAKIRASDELEINKIFEAEAKVEVEKEKEFK